MSKRKFLRRVYRHFGEFVADLRFMFKHRPMIRLAMRELIPADFRERLMMVVTEVNGCRYCSYYHARQSVEAGLSQEDVRELLSGSIPADTPQEELPALLYTQHWAESDAHPDPQASQEMANVYGAEKAEAIHIILRMIRMGNLMGNMFDYWLFCLSFGRLGLHEREQRYARL